MSNAVGFSQKLKLSPISTATEQSTQSLFRLKLFFHVAVVVTNLAFTQHLVFLWLGSKNFEYIASIMAKEAGMFIVYRTGAIILGCKCEIIISQNAANMCARCAQAEFDITKSNQKHVFLMWCSECQSDLQPPKTWIKALLDSNKLLLFCLKSLKNLNWFEAFNAEFVWNEPRSKRIKVKMKKKVPLGVAVRQAYIVDYVEVDHMCEGCPRIQANPDQWVTFVRLRQHVPHQRTCFYLGQLIHKRGAAVRVIQIKQMDEGICLFFVDWSHAFIDANLYWRAPLWPLLSHKQLAESIILDVEPVGSEVHVVGSKYVLQVSDFWGYSKMFIMQTHLGHLLNPGDYARRCDLFGANSNDMELDKYKSPVISDAILVKKCYKEKRLKKTWKASTLDTQNNERGGGYIF